MERLMSKFGEGPVKPFDRSRLPFTPQDIYRAVESEKGFAEHFNLKTLQDVDNLIMDLFPEDKWPEGLKQRQDFVTVEELKKIFPNQTWYEDGKVIVDERKDFLKSDKTVK